MSMVSSWPISAFSSLVPGFGMIVARGFRLSKHVSGELQVIGEIQAGAPDLQWVCWGQQLYFGQFYAGCQ